LNVETTKHLVFILNQNRPSPFNSSTTLSYELKEPGNVMFEVFNSAGQKVRTLVNDYQQSGSYNLNVDLEDQASGVYINRLTMDGKSTSGKMMYTK
jgi:hypothetical protein